MLHTFNTSASMNVKFRVFSSVLYVHSFRNLSFDSV